MSGLCASYASSNFRSKSSFRIWNIFKWLSIVSKLYNSRSKRKEGIVRGSWRVGMLQGWEIPTGVEASLNFLQVEHNLPRGECEDVM